MSQNLISVHIERTEVLLAEPIRTAWHTWTRRKSALLWLADAHGNRAAGELAPLPGYSPDVLEEAVTALATLAPGEWQTAVEIDNPAEALLFLDERISALLPSARFAAGCAVLQLKAWRLGSPLSDVLSSGMGISEPAAFSNTQSSVAHSEPRSAVLLSLNAEWHDALLRARAKGTRCFKLKLGAVDARELSWLQELRDSLVPGERLRLDANGGLAQDVELQRLAELAPEFVEEPWPAEQLGTPRDLGFPLALDESLWRYPEAAERWLRSGHVHAVVLKPMTLGLSGCRFWAERSRQVAAKVVISHLFDGVVAFAAYRQLAAVLGSPDIDMGLGLHQGLQLWSGEESGA